MNKQALKDENFDRLIKEDYHELWLHCASSPAVLEAFADLISLKNDDFMHTARQFVQHVHNEADVLADENSTEDHVTLANDDREYHERIDSVSTSRVGGFIDACRDLFRFS